MIFHIAVCSPDPVLRGRVQRHCMEYYARRADACIVEQLESTAALLQQEKAGSRYELYLIELPAANPLAGKSGEGLYFIDKELSTLDTQN